MDPLDLGFSKYAFERITPKGKVLVVRWTKFHKDQVSEVQEAVYMNTYLPCRVELLIYNSGWNFFNEDENQPTVVAVKFAGQPYRLPRGTQCTASGMTHDGKVFVHFSNDERWEFNSLIEDYNLAKQRIPKLPAASPNGGWGGLYRPEVK